MRLDAPWTPEEVEALNRWQADDHVHSFTCVQDRSELVAEVDGWRCPTCGYRQTWAHDFMTMPRSWEPSDG